MSDDGTAEDAERSELYLYLYTFVYLFKTIMLILRFSVAQQRRNVIRLLQDTGVGRLFQFATGVELDDEEDGGDFNPRWRRRRKPRPDPNRFPKVPSDEGMELMNSGAFGSNEAQAVTSNDVHNMSRKKKLAMRIMDRELAIESPAKRRLNNRLMAQVGLVDFASSKYC
jgi:WD repeat-containing protein 23